ncbi:hypothetical protein DM860_001678 [Cuscuta australis]|uniref:Uncharacterized protein n=1 Tax=Cuscuta australis TaxID=267555 RepID=A0A328EAA6_9ASTE|nr:hypothetical protein DM860_001678 [Cuscuta australis]
MLRKKKMTANGVSRGFIYWPEQQNSKHMLQSICEDSNASTPYPHRPKKTFHHAQEKFQNSNLFTSACIKAEKALHFNLQWSLLSSTTYNNKMTYLREPLFYDVSFFLNISIFSLSYSRKKITKKNCEL